ncbi:MAG: hypothetical protein LQ346_005120 [Caloplaca aetnensis]|nr:MAG: hypothetical protein LQ346_005120 [Caloplaca aetnensis]
MDFAQHVDDRLVDTLDEGSGLFVSLVVVKREVKTIKQALEACGHLDKSLKITSYAPSINGSLDIHSIRHISNIQRHNDTKRSAPHFTWGLTDHLVDHHSSSDLCTDSEQKFVIPTTFEVGRNDETLTTRSQDALLSQLGLSSCHQAVVELHLTYRRRPSARLLANHRSLLAQVVRRWLDSMPSSVELRGRPYIESLLEACNWSYTIYAPMLLLPSTFLSKPPWPELVERRFRPNDLLRALYEMICEQLKVTHLAVNGPIPALLPDRAWPANVLRSPTELVPLHGDFGEPNLPPTTKNFQDAFWVSAVQNGITQVWAPLYTMFSRGNIREKTRLLRLATQPSTLCQTASPFEPKNMSAVDLYAGIGYFAFSYARAGISKVICWELNSWSIEGLRRGAEKNGWGTKIVRDVDSQQEIGDERLLVFHESNVNAARRARALRERVPPIRHVNCGYLPSSSESWNAAIRVLDPAEGGWIHAHENVAAKHIAERKQEVVEVFEDLVDEYHLPSSSTTPSFRVECQHVEQVKAYGPGIIHCVFDIAILPSTPL